jgi:hypothetical protein
MRASRFAWLAIVIFSGAVVAAQVVPAVEIQDSGLRKMQQDATPQLRQVGKNIAALHFDYPFYFSRKLDVDERQQQRLDQHSIRFEHFNGATVVAISGNYYGAYSSVKFSEERRARETFLDVVLPILKATVPVFRSNPVVQGYAVEVSHHVFGKTMGMPIERAENLMVYVPQGAAVKLVEAQNKMQQEVAMLESKVFLNANPIDIWLTEDEQPGTNELRVSQPETFAETTAPATLKIAVESSLNAQPLPANPSVAPDPTRFATPPPPTPAPPPTPPPVPIPVRDTSPETLAALFASIEGVSNQLVKELELQAHFITYAPPAMIAFRHQVYLELSISTTISEPPGTSRYKLAALAFDDHISPLIRRVLSHFQGDQSFDGISFSTTVHAPVKAVNSPRTQTPISVEFFFPLSDLRCYESFDCSGQQLIDAGTVLINGERVTLDLQLAEGLGRP